MLHSFNFNGSDGAFPYAGVVFDSAGNLYTTTQSGGTYHAGTVVELSPSQGGGWTEKVLYSFNSTDSDGSIPCRTGHRSCRQSIWHDLRRRHSGRRDSVRVVAQRKWRLDGDGVAPLRPPGTPRCARNASPCEACVLDGAGNLYGTTYCGGTYDHGSVFELTPNGSGRWTEKVLHSFNNNGSDGLSRFDRV